MYAVILGMTLLWSAVAAARPRTISSNRLQLAGTLSYTLGMDHRALRDLDPWGLGLGGRVGYTFDFGLYVGMQAQFHEGDYLSYDSDGLSYNARQFGGTAGFDLWVGRQAVFRPSLAFGFHSVNVEELSDYYYVRPFGTREDTQPTLERTADRLDRADGPYLGPGIELLIFSEALFISFEGRAHVIFGDRSRFYAVSAAVSVGLAL